MDRYFDGTFCEHTKWGTYIFKQNDSTLISQQSRNRCVQVLWGLFRKWDWCYFFHFIANKPTFLKTLQIYLSSYKWLDHFLKQLINIWVNGIWVGDYVQPMWSNEYLQQHYIRNILILPRSVCFNLNLFWNYQKCSFETRRSFELWQRDAPLCRHVSEIFSKGSVSHTSLMYGSPCGGTGGKPHSCLWWRPLHRQHWNRSLLLATKSSPANQIDTLEQI